MKVSQHRYNSSQHIFSKSYENPNGVRHAGPIMVSGIPSNVKPHSPVVPASSETTHSLNQNVTRSAIMKHAVNSSLIVPAQSIGAFENKDANATHMNQFPNKLPAQVSSDQKHHWETPHPMFFPSQDPSTSQYSHGMSFLNTLPSPLPSITNYPFHPRVLSQMMIPRPDVEDTDLHTSQISHAVISSDKPLPPQVC